MHKSTQDSIHAKETSFHDQWASQTNLASVAVDEFFTAPLALENKFILTIIGDPRGVKILDIGAGLGESSVYFAKLGADVTATDISPQMMETATQLASLHGVSIKTAVGPAETLPLEPSSFDVVYVANTIHHVADKEKLILNCSKYLRPGGLFVSWDPVKYNPVINIYRNMANEVRTEDEFPLGTRDLKLIQKIFPHAKAKFFWIFGLAIFMKYFLINNINPNSERYWKRIYKESQTSLWWWKPLNALDGLVTHIPIIKWLSWNMVIYAYKHDSKEIT